MAHSQQRNIYLYNGDHFCSGLHYISCLQNEKKKIQIYQSSILILFVKRKIHIHFKLQIKTPNKSAKTKKRESVYIFFFTRSPSYDQFHPCKISHKSSRLTSIPLTLDFPLYKNLQLK